MTGTIQIYRTLTHAVNYTMMKIHKNVISYA